MDDLFKTNNIRTFTGKFIDVLNPDPELICIEDIAHALSNLCRFGGHSSVFYSVAEHCIHCAMQIERHLTLEALMHDASEAYLLDLPRPIKNRFPFYRQAEDQLMRIIAKKFYLGYPFPSQVKYIDEVCLRQEYTKLMDQPGFTLSMLGEWHVLTSKQSERWFLNIYRANSSAAFMEEEKILQPKS